MFDVSSFAAPSETDSIVYVEIDPGNSILHSLLFLGFVHVWISALKKQLKYDSIRRNAIPIVLVIGATLALLVNSYFYLNFSTLKIFSIHLGLDLVGVLFGFITFKFIYRGCV